MPPKLSRRWESMEHEPNALTVALEARKISGEPVLDLTVSNPTQCGIAIPEWLGLLENSRSKTYQPHSQGAVEARAAVAAYYEEKSIPTSPDDIFLTSGTSEGYTHLLKLLCDPGNLVLAPAPSYPLLANLAALENVRLEPYRFELGSDSKWKLDRDAVLAGIKSGARAILVVQPNNPTGHLLDAEDAEFLAATAEKNDVALIIDEVFADYLHGSALPVFPAVSSPVFYLQGLSKLLGLPQLKLSWIRIRGGGEDVQQPLEWICDAYLSVGGPVQAATPDLLSRRSEFQTPIRNRLAANLKSARDFVANHSGLNPLWPQGGWTLPILCPGVTDDEAFALKLLEKGIQVQPGYFYDFAVENAIIVSLLSEPGNFARGLQVIAEHSP